MAAGDEARVHSPTVSSSPATLPDLPASDRAERVREVLERRKLKSDVTAAQATASWEQDRFVARARALFVARLMFLSLGLLIFAVPEWSLYFGLHGPVGIATYVTMLIYSVANLLVIDHPRAGRWVTYVTLCLDLVVLVVLVVKPEQGGGLQSPLLATQLLFTTLFAVLFPKPLAILPPLLMLPVTTQLDLLLLRDVRAVDLLTVLWYSGLNIIIVYVLVYMNQRETAAHREVVALQDDLKDLAVVEERSRLSREIHDGLGASLSALIIQSEYLLQFAQDDALRGEILELKGTAEESMEELRRALQMMREDFELARGLSDHLRNFRERTQLDVTFESHGTPYPLPPDTQLAVFRILQECLANAAKHAAAQRIQVRMAYAPGRVDLSVSDDGRGFATENTRHGHYGLRNMHERAVKLGADLILDSAPGKGTRIHLSIPTSR